MEVPGWLRESRVGTAAHDHSILFVRHLRDVRPGLVTERLARHASGHGHHHIDREVAVSVDDCIGIHLQIDKRPPLVEHA